MPDNVVFHALSLLFIELCLIFMQFQLPVGVILVLLMKLVIFIVILTLILIDSLAKKIVLLVLFQAVQLVEVCLLTLSQLLSQVQSAHLFERHECTEVPLLLSLALVPLPHLHAHSILYLDTATGLTSYSLLSLIDRATVRVESLVLASSRVLGVVDHVG